MRTEKIHKLLLNPITWGVVGLIIAAITFSGMVSMNISYILLFVAFLVGCFGIFRAVKRIHVSIMFCLFLGIGLALISYLIKPSPQTTPPEIKLEFKNSALFTPARRNKITTELNAFRNYLVGIGFEVPKETPAMGITVKGKGMVSASSDYFGDPALDMDIYIGRESIDDLTAWRSAYAYYVFNQILSIHPYNDVPHFFIRTRCSWIFEDYYANSYANKQPKNLKGVDGWVGALWEIRDSLGQDFTDRSLFYTYKSIILDKEEKGFEIINDEDVKVFNNFFSRHFFDGAWVLDNNYQSRSKIAEILKKYKLI
jgi:hypothetical protein